MNRRRSRSSGRGGSVDIEVKARSVRVGDNHAFGKGYVASGIARETEQEDLLKVQLALSKGKGQFVHRR